jgi:hypothetical protein
MYSGWCARRTASAERNAKTRAETAEKLANLRLGAGATGFGQEYDQLPARQQAVVDWYATQQLGGDSTWRVGLSRAAGGANLIKAVDEYVPVMAGELGLDAADVGTNRATRVASQAALTQNTKDLATLKPYVDMLDQNVDILKEIASSMPTQRPPEIVRVQADPPRPQQPRLAKLPTVSNDPQVQISFSARSSTRKQMFQVALDLDMTLKALVLVALRDKYPQLDIQDADLLDLRAKR